MAEHTKQYVYFAVSGEEVKIGTSNNPPRRVKGMQIVRPDLKLLAYIPGGIETEARLHQRFQKFRIIGECFHLVAEIQEFVKEQLDAQYKRSVALKPEEERFLTRKLLSERWKQYGYSENSIRRGEKRLGLHPYRFLRDVRYRLSDIIYIEAAGILLAGTRRSSHPTVAERKRLTKSDSTVSSRQAARGQQSVHTGYPAVSLCGRTGIHPQRNNAC